VPRRCPFRLAFFRHGAQPTDAPRPLKACTHGVGNPLREQRRAVKHEHSHQPQRLSSPCRPRDKRVLYVTHSKHVGLGSSARSAVLGICAPPETTLMDYVRVFVTQARKRKTQSENAAAFAVVILSESFHCSAGRNDGLSQLKHTHSWRWAAPNGPLDVATKQSPTSKRAFRFASGYAD
jgi:hypothetical protein